MKKQRIAKPEQLDAGDRIREFALEKLGRPRMGMTQSLNGDDLLQVIYRHRSDLHRQRVCGMWRAHIGYHRQSDTRK